MTNYGPAEQIPLRINPNAVGLPAKLAASECYTIFAVAVDAFRTADLDNPPEIDGETVSHQMHIGNRSQADQRKACDRRLTAMCISDLARGIRASMEAASAYIEFRKLDMKTLMRPTELDVMKAANSKLSELTSDAQALSYPPLLEKVQAGLNSPLAWAPELASFQKVRNCLEHRGGIVGDRDLDADGVLRLRLPVLEFGVVGDSGDWGPLPLNKRLEKATKIGMRVTVREQTFYRGQVLKIPPSGFREIAFAVWLFSEDLLAKLVKTNHGPSGTSDEQVVN